LYDYNGDGDDSREAYIRDIQHDLGIISRFRSIIERLMVSEYRFQDDKLDSLKRIISTNKDKKIIVFTQFTDTARYIHDNIKDCGLIDGKIKLVSGGIKNKVVEAMQFSPSSYPEEMKRKVEEKYRVTLGAPYTKLLVTTDTFSEGVNLTEADVVINYDLPWNPIRIVQRVGRANRIGRTGGIDVINFIPDDNIDRVMQLIKTLKKKIKNIIMIIGSEYCILSPEEMHLIRQKKVNDLEMFKAKRELVRGLKIDEIEKSEYRTKLSDLDKFLIDAINKNHIKMQDLERVVVPDKCFYTVLPYVDDGQLYIYKVTVGDDSYHKHECEMASSGISESIPLPRSFISPRTRIYRGDIVKMDAFKKRLTSIKNRRKKSQGDALDKKTNRAKGRLVAKLRSITGTMHMQIKNRVATQKINEIARRIDKLNPPPMQKRLITRFESKWIDNSYLKDLEGFVKDLTTLASDLEVVSEIVVPTSAINASLASFILYDKEWKAARKKQKQ